MEQNCSLPMMDNVSQLVAHDLLPQSDKSSCILHIQSSDIRSCFKLKSIIIPKHLKTLAALIDFGSVSSTSKPASLAVVSIMSNVALAVC